MKKFTLLLVLFVAIFAFSCKKESIEVPVVQIAESDIVSFSVNSQVGSAAIQKSDHTISLVIPSTLNRANLTVNISVSANATVSLNGSPKSNTITADFSKPVVLNVTASNGNVTNWTITVLTDMEYFGLYGTPGVQKSLSKSFEWYYDQGNTGTYSSINCGPAVSTMAAKWADSTFSRTVEQARGAIRNTGGWWYTNDVTNYLGSYGINTTITQLPDNYQTIKKVLDKNYILILCLDNYYITYNGVAEQRVDKFYTVGAKDSGHFIVIKGYKQVGNKFYLEAYDPWSLGKTYALDGSLKGKSRYYSSDDLEMATGVWWDYAIIVAPKGKSIILGANSGLKVLSQQNIPVQKGA